MEYNSDMYEQGESGNRYISIQNVPTIWIVHVNDYLKNVGHIYINSETGEILKVVINGNTMENMMKEGHQTNDSSASINTTNATDPLPQDTSDNTTTIVISIISILIIAGAVGYWFKIRK
jgi:hypothetical protein